MSKFAKDYSDRQMDQMITILQEILQSLINIEDRLRKIERNQPNPLNVE